MAKQRRSAVPGIVLGLVLFFVAGLLVLLGALIWQSYYERIERTRSEAQTASQVVAVHARWLIEASRQSLRRIDGAIGPTLRASITADTTIREELAGLPADVRFGIYGSAGQRLVGDSDTPTDVAGQAYFALLSSGSPGQISSLIIEEGRPARFAISRRLERAGQFAGAAVIFVSASVMVDFWSSLSLGPNSTVSMIHTDGWLIARFPTLAAPLDLRSYALFTEYLPKAEAGSYVAERSPADGAPRVVGYRTLPNLPVVAIASISLEATMAQYWGGVVVVLAFIMPLMIAVVAGAVWLHQIMRRDERTRLELAQAIEDNKMLLREIHHRVKNNLQAVSSLVQLQQLAPAAKQEMSRRIAAMVSVHEHIYRSDQFASPQVDSYIRMIVENARQGFDAPVEIAYDLAPVRVDVDHAMPLGLIVSEVVSNAFKHGFPDGRQGKLRVEFGAVGNDGRLVIADNGVGFDPADSAGGMGRRLIEGLTVQLSGECSYARQDGTVFTLTFPLSKNNEANA